MRAEPVEEAIVADAMEAARQAWSRKRQMKSSTASIMTRCRSPRRDEDFSFALIQQLSRPVDGRLDENYDLQDVSLASC